MNVGAHVVFLWTQHPLCFSVLRHVKPLFPGSRPQASIACRQAVLTSCLFQGNALKFVPLLGTQGKTEDATLGASQQRVAANLQGRDKLVGSVLCNPVLARLAAVIAAQAVVGTKPDETIAVLHDVAHRVRRQTVLCGQPFQQSVSLRPNVCKRRQHQDTQQGKYPHTACKDTNK